MSKRHQDETAEIEASPADRLEAAYRATHRAFKDGAPLTELHEKLQALLDAGHGHPAVEVECHVVRQLADRFTTTPGAANAPLWRLVAEAAIVRAWALARAIQEE